MAGGTELLGSVLVQIRWGRWEMATGQEEECMMSRIETNKQVAIVYMQGLGSGDSSTQWLVTADCWFP